MDDLGVKKGKYVGSRLSNVDANGPLVAVSTTNGGDMVLVGGEDGMAVEEPENGDGAELLDEDGIVEAGRGTYEAMGVLLGERVRKL